MIVRRNASDPENCVNCGERIGKLETPYLWQQHVVCGLCYEKLSRSTPINKPPEIDYASVAPPNIPQTKQMAREISRRTCPICGSTKPPVKKAKGSALLCIFLLLLWIIPGIIYGIVCGGYAWVCPDCGAKLGDIK
jgi:hypothetical protein